MRHGAACFGAGVAVAGAGLAMVMVVLGAFVAAALADIGAQRADGLGMFAATCHGGGCKVAQRGAVHVERNAARHHLHVVFLQASAGAVVAGDGAGVAGCDAGGEGAGYSGRYRSRGVPAGRPRTFDYSAPDSRGTW